MDKMSDRLECVDKTIEICNDYVQTEMERIKNEIQFLDSNSNNINELRRYFVKFLGRERVLQLSDAAINDLLTIRANDLYLHYQVLSRHRINTIPLKIIIQGLKFNKN